MKCCPYKRFLNEQTYLDAVCCARKRKNCCDKPPRCDAGHDLRYTYRCPQGKLTLHCDNRSAGISIDVNHCNGEK